MKNRNPQPLSPEEKEKRKPAFKPHELVDALQDPVPLPPPLAVRPGKAVRVAPPKSDSGGGGTSDDPNPPAHDADAERCPCPWCSHLRNNEAVRAGAELGGTILSLDACPTCGATMPPGEVLTVSAGGTRWRVLRRTCGVCGDVYKVRCGS